MKVKYTTFFNKDTDEDCYPRFEAQTNGLAIITKDFYTDGDNLEFIKTEDLLIILDEINRLKKINNKNK
jgi:hypothetical protein